MNFGDLNFLIILFFLLLFSLVVNINTSLHLLLTAELLWIILYSVALLGGLVYDNLNIISLTFFFLVLSAIEFGIGLILLLFQNIITRSVSLNDGDLNAPKFDLKNTPRTYINKINWKL